MKVIKKESREEVHLNHLNKENRYYLTMHLALLGTGFLMSVMLWSIFPVLIGYLTSQLTIRAYWKEARDEQASLWTRVSGEHATERQLAHLSDDWHLFKDVSFGTNHSEKRANHIVIGPHGVFAIETRNWFGHLVPGENANKVKQIIGFEGKKITLELDNPIERTKENIQALKEYLDKQGLAINVKGCVYIPNIETEVALHDNEVPAFSQPEVFFKYIDNFPYSEKLSKETIKQISTLLKSRAEQEESV